MNNFEAFIAAAITLLKDPSITQFDGNNLFDRLTILENQYGVTSIGTGTNRKAYLYNRMVYKIPHRLNGISDNQTEYYLSRYAELYCPEVLNYMAVTTKALTPDCSIIEQEYIEPLKEKVKAEGLRDGIGVFRKLNSVEGYAMYTDMIRALEKAFLIVDMSMYTSLFNIGVKVTSQGIKFATLDYGYFFPLFGKVIMCPDHGKPMSYFIPQREDLTMIDDAGIKAKHITPNSTERYVDLTTPGCRYGFSPDTISGIRTDDLRAGMGNIEAVFPQIYQAYVQRFGYGR